MVVDVLQLSLTSYSSVQGGDASGDERFGITSPSMVLRIREEGNRMVNPNISGRVVRGAWCGVNADLDRTAHAEPMLPS
jgi:hypothetical protein